MEQGEITQKFSILNACIDEAAPEFIEKVQEAIQEQEKNIFQAALPYYKKGGRFYDLWHIPLSTHFMHALCTEENMNRNVFMNAVILHDSGYGKIAEDEGNVRKGNISAGGRVEHMKWGQVIAKEVFSQVQNNLTQEEQEQVCAIIATHDNPYIGKPLTTREEKLHRDADRMYVISFTSFVKDYLRYIEKDPAITPREFMKIRVCMFYTPEQAQELEIDEQFKPTMQDWEKYKQKFEPMFTEFAEKQNKKQLHARVKDVQNNIFNMNNDEFKRYCQKRMQEEMQYSWREAEWT